MPYMRTMSVVSIQDIVAICKFQYLNVQQVENKNVHLDIYILKFTNEVLNVISSTIFIQNSL